MKILPFFTLFSLVFLGFFVALVHFNSRRSRVIRNFVYLGGVICLWLLFYSLAFLQSVYSSALPLFKLGYVCITIIPIAFYSFSQAFLNRESKASVAFFIASIPFICSLIFGDFIKGLYTYPWGYYPKVDQYLHILFLVYFFTIFSVGMAGLFIEFYLRKNFSGVRRERLKYVLLGSMIGSMGAIDFLPNYGFEIVPVGFLFMMSYPLCFAYAIVRYRLMDVKLVFTRAGIFVIVYIFVLGIPFLITNLLRHIFELYLQDNWWMVPLLISTFFATLGPFLYLYFDKRAENALLKEQRSYQNILRSASLGMIRIKDLNRLVSLIVRVITKTVRISYSSIYLFDAERDGYFRMASRGHFFPKRDFLGSIDAKSPLIQRLLREQSPVVAEEVRVFLSENLGDLVSSALLRQLDQLGASLVIPSFVDSRLIGVLVMGDKVSGRLYSVDDLTVFSVLANQAALAIENAQFYVEIRQTQEQLFQAEKLATIGTMADGLSHQINNRFHAMSLIAGDSLDAIKVFDTAKCDEETKKILDQVKGSLERIEANVLQGGEVVKGLLKYSRPGESGFEPVDFRDVIKGAIDMVQYKIKLKEIDLVQDIPDGLPRLNANLTQLQEVFFNLIDNAYDAIKERQMTLKEEGYRGRVEISATDVDGSVEVVVRDNGMGIKDPDRKKLFTPFFTTKATAKKGTGLGLYVIEKIVSAHGAKISIASVYRDHTTFSIILPSVRPA